MDRRNVLSVMVLLGVVMWIGACEPEKKEAPKEEKKTAATPEKRTPPVEEKRVAAKPEERAAPQEQKQAPTWDLDGKIAPEIQASTWFNTPKPLTLKEFQKAKFVLLEFWFTACPHCVVEVPRIQDFYNRFTGPKFQLITIVSDLKDNRQTVENFIKDHNITFPIAIDNNAKTFEQYAMRKVPFVYIINRYGYVVWQGHPHYLEASQISDILALAEGR